MREYINIGFEFLETKIKNYSKEKQAYIGAIIISSASIPVFLLILIFNITNVGLLDSMSSFASGALVGDVFLHNLPEIYGANSDEENNFFLKKQTLLGIGIIFLFAFEKFIKLLMKKDNKIKGKLKNSF